MFDCGALATHLGRVFRNQHKVMGPICSVVAFSLLFLSWFPRASPSLRRVAVDVTLLCFVLAFHCFAVRRKLLTSWPGKLQDPPIGARKNVSRQADKDRCYR